MANNTARRGIYLPKELDDWYVERSANEGMKINAVMIEALTEYMERSMVSKRKESIEFEKKVYRIIKKYNDENGIQDAELSNA